MKFLLNEATEPEQLAVRQWLESGEEQRRYFEQLKQVWQESRKQAEVSTVDVDAAWNRFRSRVVVNNNIKEREVKPLFRLWRVAAAVILVMLLAGTWWWMNSSEPVRYLAFQTQAEPKSDTLSDGSVVSLNRESKIEYPSKFSRKQRQVKLKGEAFFEVKPDSSRPFRIEAGDVRITVLGTSFNVKETGAAVEVVVETGKVKVEKDGKSVILTAGQKLLVGRAANWETNKEEQTDRLYQYYRSNSFVCDSTPLWRLAQVLEEAYGVKIEFARSSIRELRWDVTIENESLDQVLNLIGQTFDIKVKRDGDRIIFQ